MALIFLDSFDHYDNLELKWFQSAVGAGIDLSGNFSRTGIGCCTLGGAFGPTYGFTARTTVIIGTAWYTPTLGSFNTRIVELRDLAGNNTQVTLHYLADGSVAAYAFNSPFEVLLGTSDPGILLPNVYNYVEMLCTKSTTQSSLDGTVIVRVNGAVVLNLTGVNNAFTGTPYTGVRLMADPLAGGRHDDFYLCDDLGGVNDSFLGAVRLYAGTPISDSAPLQWTPSTGSTHFNLVDEIPPDEAEFVSSNTPGDQDQYIHSDGSAPTTGNQILGIQHVLCAKLDAAGSRSIASCVDGSPKPIAGHPLTTDYQMLSVPYDTNPTSGVQWDFGDLATIPFGPQVIS